MLALSCAGKGKEGLYNFQDLNDHMCASILMECCKLFSTSTRKGLVSCVIIYSFCQTNLLPCCIAGQTQFCKTWLLHPPLLDITNGRKKPNLQQLKCQDKCQLLLFEQIHQNCRRQHWLRNTFSLEKKNERVSWGKGRSERLLQWGQRWKSPRMWEWWFRCWVSASRSL